MGAYSEGLGRYLNRDEATLKTTGAETASTTHSPVEVGDKAVINVEVLVSAVTGTTPTMLITIEGSNDGLTWYALGEIGSDSFGIGSLAAPANITAAGTYRAALPAARYVRSKSTITGTTPSFTYGIALSAA